MNRSTVFTPMYPLNTAVLFVVFNRIETTVKVFSAIRNARPPRLYIAADGARENKTDEANKVRVVRDYILRNVDWDCEIKTLFRGENLGCKYGVSSAISWFFKHEDFGIILEDDCVPDQSFFWFCEEMLKKYQSNFRVGQISGDNFQNGIRRGEADYYFSRYNHIWGWATWADRWESYDVELSKIKRFKPFEEIFHSNREKLYWKDIFKKTKSGKIDTWDYQWTFTLWAKNQLTILPNVNLISNIGFGIDATHTTIENEFSNLQTDSLQIKNHPATVQREIDADRYTAERWFFKRRLTSRLMNRFKNIFYK